MSRTGRAVVTHGRDFEIREYPVPDPAPGTVLLRQELTGICGTDLHNWQKGLPVDTLQGHEVVGIVEALGSGVSVDYLGNRLREGDRVVFHPPTAASPTAFAERTNLTGGFAEYVYLKDPVNCIIKTLTPPQVAS